MTSSAPVIVVGMALLLFGYGGLAGRFGDGPHPGDQEPTRYAPPVRGPAELGYLAPDTTVDGETVVTTIKVKNPEGSPVAGLKAGGFRWDRSGNLVSSAVMRFKKSHALLEVATITLITPRNSRMFQHAVRFSHSFGPVKALRFKALD